MVISDIKDTTTEFSGTIVVVNVDRGIATVRDFTGKIDIVDEGFTTGDVREVTLQREDRKWTVAKSENAQTSLRNLYPSSTFSHQELHDRIVNLINEFVTDPEYLSLCEAAIASDFFNGFLDSPAAATHHHAYVGGLAEHTCSMFELAVNAATHYERQFPDMIDLSLLCTGVFFHDFMKVQELAFNGRITYTETGNLIGHIPLVAAWILELDAEISEPKRRLAAHLALSHHGKREYGAPIEPKTVEAILLHHIDMIDSRMNMCWNSIEHVESGWTPYHRALGTRLLVHNKDET